MMENSRKMLGSTLALFALLVVARFAAKANSQDASGQKPAIVILTDANNGKSFTLNPGDSLVFRLPVRNGTGYTWQIVKSKQQIVTLQGEPSRDPPPSAMPGAAADQIFHFVAQKNGKTKLEFEYLRPWEKHEPPAKTFYVTIVVR